MMKRGGAVAAATAMLASCVGAPNEPNPWDPSETLAALGVAADDPWCGHMQALRTYLDGEGPRPDAETRRAAIDAVRAEAAASKEGDPYWPFRKALICEYAQGAAEERTEFDWITTEDFLAAALAAGRNPAPADGISPLVPVFDHLDGAEPESIQPVDLTEPAYCDGLDTSELALSQQRGDVVDAVSFPGSIQRAPDWFAMIQVAYHRWGREHLEGHQTDRGDYDFGGIPWHCRRFHAALEGSKEFAIKDNLIFLLPELDDPERAGRLVVRDAAGNEVVLDRVLAAAQTDADGSGGETVDFYPSDLRASPLLAGAVDRTNQLPPPKTFQIFFDTNDREVPADDEGAAALRAELGTRDPAEPLRIALSGYSDCVGARWYNQLLSEARAKAVFEDIVRPSLIAQGFSEETLGDKRRFKLSGLGETKATREAGRCEGEDMDRRVTVIVQ